MLGWNVENAVVGNGVSFTGGTGIHDLTLSAESSNELSSLSDLTLNWLPIG